MKLVTFASGSGGNCALVREGDGGVLIDAGISLRRIKAGLARQGLTLGDLDGILITHEHGDHVAALPMLLKYSDLTVYATRTVANRLLRSVLGLEDRIAVVGKEEPFSLHHFRITPFSTSHDTDESVGYRLEGENILVTKRRVKRRSEVVNILADLTLMDHGLLVIEYVLDRILYSDDML